MKRLALVAAAVFFAAPASAADLLVDQAAPAADALLADSIYVQLLGGVALPGILEHHEGGSFDHDHDLEAGWAASLALGYEFDNGLAVELDLLHTHRTAGDDRFTTTSLMGGLKYTLAVTDTVAVYAGAGIGGIGSDDHVWAEVAAGAGYQLKLGAQVQVTDNLALVGEYRFQNAFSAMPSVDDDYYASLAPVSTAMAGLKLSF